MPERGHCAFGALHPRRIHGVILQASVSNACFMAAFHRIEPAGAERDRRGGPKGERAGASESNALQFPNRLAADDRPHRAAFQLPAVKWRIARRRFKLIDPDCPFQFRVNQRHISSRAD